MTLSPSKWLSFYFGLVSSGGEKALSFTLLGSWLSVKIEVTRTVTRGEHAHLFDRCSPGGGA